MSKKLLIQEIFEKARKESGKDSKSGIALFLSLFFYDEWKFEISERTFVRYYDAFIIEGEEKNIDSQTLDKMSQYLGFKNYRDFCRSATFTKINKDSSHTSVNVRIDEGDDSERKHPNITVNITTNPILKFQEILAKQSGFGLIGLLIFGGFLTGSYFKREEKPVAKYAEVKADVPKQNLSSGENSPAVQITVIPAQSTTGQENKLKEEKVENYMYWDGERFVATAQASLGSQYAVVPMNKEKLKYFTKITKPDTITSIKNVWYSKHHNVLEFFTSDGKNPENGKELRPVSDYIFKKYLN